MNTGDVVVVAAIIALVALAIWLMRRTRAKGGCSCCPHAEECAKRQP
ncbi:MAG: FeoB-associated Cys-rich membrane protein [Atopobiaceae bacterium]|nr:FeoB-associated Cys-rich membrane protein [Atopobiaceae bacterium]